MPAPAAPPARRPPCRTAPVLPRRRCPAQSTGPWRPTYRSPPAQRAGICPARPTAQPPQPPAHTTNRRCAATAPRSHAAAPPARPPLHREQSSPPQGPAQGPAQRASALRTAPPSPRQTPGPPLPADAPPGAILPALPAPEPRCAGLLPSKHSSALSSRIPRFPAGRFGSVPRTVCIYCSAERRQFLPQGAEPPQTGSKTQKSPAACKNAAGLCVFMEKISRSASQWPL